VSNTGYNGSGHIFSSLYVKENFRQIVFYYLLKIQYSIEFLLIDQNDLINTCAITENKNKCLSKLMPFNDNVYLRGPDDHISR